MNRTLTAFLVVQSYYVGQPDTRSPLHLARQSHAVLLSQSGVPGITWGSVVTHPYQADTPALSGHLLGCCPLQGP